MQPMYLKNRCRSLHYGLMRVGRKEQTFMDRKLEIGYWPYRTNYHMEWF